MIKNFEMAVSALNLELIKSKKDHKEEKEKLLDKISKLEIELKDSNSAMESLVLDTEQLVQDLNKKVEEQNEYLEAYQAQIEKLESKIATLYFEHE
jgi:seryl-tRNA synthetase